MPAYIRIGFGLTDPRDFEQALDIMAVHRTK
jgi:hypothetical protein